MGALPCLLTSPMGLPVQAPRSQRDRGRPRARSPPSLDRGRWGMQGLPASPPVPPTGSHSLSGVSRTCPACHTATRKQSLKQIFWLEPQ
ncbi:hypothetical protein Cadr_000020832 [Camelus dromedarius]|uniref:Uncharacterized protein n=1 Tax=Camelus dromedarius TaxID=9838 RepID=A0A5N4CU68_CAMDR|nr:hypothetical protein Cadr_000020832 [Camelus dromedarius]